MNWRDKTIFVTGATGFIGGRICERLVQEGAAKTRALVHSMHRAARIARLPIELCPGDLLDPSSLGPAMGDSKIVIHCGLASARAIVRGTENLLEVSLKGGVERFVHMSTAAVYGLTPPPGSETESFPIRLTGDGYCDNKARAETAVGKFGKRGLPAVILRPSIVYGPYSSWSTRLIPDLKADHVALIDGGGGVCNTTYVDNLIDAIFLALENDRALGETFFVTDGERVTWADFVRAHVAMLDGHPSPANISRQEVMAYYESEQGMLARSVRASARVLRSRELRQLLLEIPITERVLSKAWGWMESLNEEQKRNIRSRLGVQPRDKVETLNGRYVPDKVELATQTGTVFFSIEKAQRLLAYSPRVEFEQGMHRVEQWLRFANYL